MKELIISKKKIVIITTVMMLLAFLSINVNAATLGLKPYLQRNYSTAYGYQDTACTKPATIATSGCALVSLTNAVYALNGNYINPSTLANFSLKNGYRVHGVGTSHAFFKAAANTYGNSYSFKFNKETTSFSELISHLNNGGTAVCNVTNHFIAIAGYKNGSFWVMDCAPSSSRGTTSNGDWKTQKQLSTGKLTATKFFLISSTSGAIDTPNPTTTAYIVTTQSSPLTIRSTPSTSGTSIGSAAKGSTVQVISISNGWAKINSPMNGYVSANYITKKSDVTTTPYIVTTQSSPLTIRSTPSTSGTSIGSAAKGSTVQVISISNGWAKINSPMNGYVSANYITKK